MYTNLLTTGDIQFIAATEMFTSTVLYVSRARCIPACRVFWMLPGYASWQMLMFPTSYLTQKQKSVRISGLRFPSSTREILWLCSSFALNYYARIKRRPCCIAINKQKSHNDFKNFCRPFFSPPNFLSFLLFHYFTISLLHCFAISLFCYFAILLFRYFAISLFR